MTAPSSERSRKWEDRLARPMFALAVLFLVLVAAAIYLMRSPQGFGFDRPAVQIVVGGLLALWPVFLMEAVVRCFLAPAGRRTWRGLAWCLAAGVLPPLRMAAHSRIRPQHVWLPWWGWQEIDFDLQKSLEQVFSAPMLLMALLILPLLAVEYFWADAVERYALLRTALGIGIGVIWVGFTIEFIMRASVAEKKLSYAVSHWVDLAVVLLPMVEFMPFLRVLRATRLMRVESLARMAKYYRLYGVAGKGWRGLVVVGVLQRLLSRSPKARLSRLQSQLESKQDEIRELEREADYFHRKIRAVEAELAESGEPGDGVLVAGSDGQQATGTGDGSIESNDSSLRVTNPLR